MLRIQKIVFDRIVKGTAAAGLEQVLNIVIQLVSVPLFLKYWGISLYGEWILLFTLPSYLAISDLGFAKAAVNSMTLSCAERNYVNANRYYHSCFTLLAALGLFTIGLIVAGLFFIPSLNEKLEVAILSYKEVELIVIALSIYILLFQQAELLRGIVSASGKFYYSMTLVGVYRFVEFCCIAVLVIRGYGPIQVAFVYLGFQVLMIVHLVIFIKLKLQWAHLGVRATFSYTSGLAIKQMLKPALAFMMLPVGYAIRNQVPIFLIGFFFNPATIVVYTTARTITNAGNQLIGTINKAITPEYALAYGSGDLNLVKSIHYNSCNIALVVSVVLFVVLLFSGGPFIRVWTDNAVPFNYQVFLTFLVSLIFNSLWSTSSYLSYSINQHTKQSVLFLMSCFISSIITYFFLKYSGFNYAAIGVVIADLIMVVYVFLRNRRLLDEEIKVFIKNVFKFPSFGMIKRLQ
jgi:O-antigen/teichoic acid export membrane protein